MSQFSHLTQLPQISRFEKPSECPICCNQEPLIAVQPCGHWICESCLTRTTNDLCSFCRTPLDQPYRKSEISSLLALLNRVENIQYNLPPEVQQIQRRAPVPRQILPLHLRTGGRQQRSTFCNNFRIVLDLAQVFCGILYLVLALYKYIF